MQASAYLGDLGGLSAHRWLVLLDLRGPERRPYRRTRPVTGATLALLYAARHPDRVSRLALINPSPRAVGLEVADLDRRQAAELRRGEAWFPDAFAALERIWSGDATVEP